MHVKRIRSFLTAAIIPFMLLPCLVRAATVTPPKPGESPTIDAIRQSGQLKAGAVILPPWLLQNPGTGKYFGPAAIVVKEAAKALKVKVHYVDATWDTIIAGLIAKKYNLAAAALFETKARKKVVDFATYDRSGTCYAVKPDSDIRSLKDVNRSSHVYLDYAGYATNTMFHEKYPKVRMALITPPPGAGPRIDDLLNGRGNITGIDSPLVFWIKQRWPTVRIVPSPETCFKHPDLLRSIGIAYSKGDPAFGQFLSNIIAAHENEIQDAKKRFSQPKWLNKH